MLGFGAPDQTPSSQVSLLPTLPAPVTFGGSTLLGLLPETSTLFELFASASPALFFAVTLHEMACS